MKQDLIITISRQYGSGGQEVGQKLAQALSIPCYDKELINLSAEKSGFSPIHFQEPDQQAPSSMLFSLLRAGTMMGSYDLSLNDKVFLVQSKVVRQLADRGPCVIVGRCADYVLADRPNCIRVFLHAPLPLRVERGRSCYHLPSDRAEDIIQKTDKRRSTYYHYYTGIKFGEATQYHLSLDTLTIGIDKAVETLAAYARNF